MKRKASLEPSMAERSVKLEKSDSPASSYVSLKPMDPPANFKEELGLNSRGKQERSESPAPSCVSVRSKALSVDFKGEFTPDSRVKQERSESPAPSCVSLRSKALSVDFKGEFTPDSSEFIANLLTKDHFRCTVCTDVLKDPVSIPCGHSYCKQCITSYWAQPNHAGHYACPQCPQSYSSHPALCTNSALAEVVQKLQQFSPVLPTHCYVGPGDVACDFCTEKKLRAVKSCLTCTASYCESHVRQHYTVPALQRHRLVEPTHFGGHQDKTDQWDIKTGDLKQAVPSHLEESLVENGNQRQLPKQQDIQTEDLKPEKASDRVVTQSQVMTAADLGMPLSPRPKTEQQQQQTTECPGMQPQQSTQQDLPSSQTGLQERLCNDNDQNQKMLEKQDRGVNGNSQDAVTVQNSCDARRIEIELYSQALEHACQCRKAKCSLPLCQEMKRMERHTHGCQRRINGGCPICKQFIALFYYHCKHCPESKCPVPFCLNLKQNLRQLQHGLKQEQKLHSCLTWLMASTGQMTMPGPQGSSSPSTSIPSAQPAMPHKHTHPQCPTSLATQAHPSPVPNQPCHTSRPELHPGTPMMLC